VIAFIHEMISGVSKEWSLKQERPAEDRLRNLDDLLEEGPDHESRIRREESGNLKDM
jgi:hypothetical protein